MSQEKTIKDEKLDQVSGGNGYYTSEWKVGDFGRPRYEIPFEDIVYEITRIIDDSTAEAIEHKLKMDDLGVPVSIGRSNYVATPGVKVEFFQLDKLNSKPRWIPNK